MNGNRIWPALGLSTGLLSATLLAQFTLSQVPAAARIAPATPANAAATPLPPQPPSPIDYFRRLLAANAAERDQQLAAKPQAQRNHLRAKLKEYDALPATERELRLRMLQLQWFLLPLMQIPPTHRAQRLASVPEDYRPVVVERLHLFDLLPPPLQREVLQRETTRNYFVRFEAGTPSEQDNPLKVFPSEKRQQLEERLTRWRALPALQRQRIFARFDRFLEMNGEDRQPVLALLPESERQRMNQTLAAFQKLNRAQRQQCIESFRKLANLTPAQRARFLQNAERWHSLSPGERQAWRQLVTKLPPLPPGLPSATPPLPPLSAAAK